MEYVVGFRIDFISLQVVLVRKNNPEWQRGLLNGVGGKIEPGETAEQAMIREFREETGVEVTDWEKTIVLAGNTFHVTFFRSFGSIESVRTTTEEKIEPHYIEQLYDLPVIPNLRWMIPMQLDNTILWPLHIKDIAISEEAHVGD